MAFAVQVALTIGAWVLLVLLLAGGLWFLRQHQLLHTALALLLICLGIFLFVRLRDLVTMLLLAGVLAFILDGLVERLSRSMPRAVAIGTVYLGLAAVLTLAGAFLFPRIGQQAHLFVQELPLYSQRLKGFALRVTAWYGVTPEQLQQWLDAGLRQVQAGTRSATGQVEHLLMAVVGGIVKGLLSVVISIYLLTDKSALGERFLRLFPAELRPEVRQTRSELALILSRYLRGQLIVVLFVSTAVTAVLLAFHIPYAFFIGFVAGVLEIIPYFGAVAGALPAVTLGFMQSPGTGVALIVFFVLINQIEGHVVIPLVMGHHLELRPLTILLALIAGEQLGGIAGMIVAVPMVALMRVLLPHVRQHYQQFRLRERGLWIPGENVEAPGRKRPQGESE
jgi:predicted PurR-regulated permease PerM